MPLASSPQKIKIFFSYAPEDTKLFHDFLSYLSTLRWQQSIEEWYDSAISLGHNFTQAIEQHLDTADIIVLFISSYFFHSERCYQLEMQRALERYNAGTVHLLPVQLRSSDWDISPIAHLPMLPASGTPIIHSTHRDVAFTEVAKGIRHIVENILQKATQTLTRPLVRSTKKAVYDVTPRFNPFFTNREAILDTLATTFLGAPSSNQTHLLALKGLAGIGKTQIVLEYINKNANHYESVLWLNASSQTTFNAEVYTLGKKLSLPQYELDNEQRLFAAIQRWLQEHTHWLLVLDHINDISLAHRLIPTHSSGHVLLTTHQQATGIVTHAISIDSMAIDASTTLLLRRAGLLHPENSHAHIPASIHQDAETLAHLMAGYPLALDQAGAYLEETGCDLASYISLYQQERAKLLNQRGMTVDISHHPESVTLTLSLAFKQVTHPELLRLLAFLQPTSIPQELLIDAATLARGTLRTLLTHPLQLHPALANLRSLSLVTHNADRTLLSIHPIVQAVVSDQLSPKQRRQWATLVVRMVSHVFPVVRFDTRTACERYLPQAQHCAKLIDEYKLTFIEGALLLERLGFYCFQRASYTDAKAYLQQALAIYTQNQDLDSLDFAQTLNSLALLHQQLSEYAAAETTHQQALVIRNKILGPNHPKTAETLHNLAMLYGDLEKYEEAEKLYLQVLTIEEQAKGTAHLDVAKTLNNLGLIYYHQEKLTQADIVYQRALAIYTRHLSGNHPDLIYPLDGLGAVAEAQEEYEKAKKLYQQAFNICQQAYGDHHPQTAHSLNKLADIAVQQGNLQEAEKLYEQAITIAEHTLGTNHPDLALFLNNLATLAVTQEKYTYAQELYTRAFHICKQTWGLEHTWVITIQENITELSQLIEQKEEK